MQLHNLKPAKGSVKKNKRLGRGQGSGRGGTSTRGHNGAQSRSGYSRKKGFEGGGVTLIQRTPKRGFKNINRVEYVPINLARLEAISDKLDTKTITPEALAENGIVKKKDKIKILGNGDLTSKLEVTAHAFSEKAKSAIEAKGGTATTL